MIVHAHMLYNILLGRLSLKSSGAIVSTPHLAMKFPSEDETIIIVHADQRMTRECYMASLRLRPHVRGEAPEVVHYVEARTKK